MPDLYCQSCKQIRPHKSVMRRNVEEVSFTTKFSVLFNQLVNGQQYYKMEPQHYCRVCNSQNFITELQEAQKVAVMADIAHVRVQ